MALSSILLFATVLAAAAASPGPGIAALVSRVVTHGLRDVLPFLIGAWLGEVAWLTIAVTGLAALAQAFGTFFIALRYLGAAYLLVLAWQMWHKPADAAPDTIPNEGRCWRMFGSGLLLSLGNPKIIVLYLALLPSIIDIQHIGVGDWAILAGVALIVIAGVDMAWAFVSLRMRRFLRSPRAVRIANRVGATAITGAAVAVAAR